MNHFNITVTDDAFFNRNWVGACGGRWAGPGLILDRSTGCASSGLGYDCCCADRQVLNVARLCKNKKEWGLGEGCARGRSDA